MSHDASTRPVIGVGMVLFDRPGDGDARILMIRRARPPRQGQWSLPGGKQELGETVEQAVRRELREETGLEAGPLRFLDLVDLIEREDEGGVRYHYTLLDFASHVSGGELIAGSDAADAAWFDTGGLTDLSLWSETRRIIELARSLR